jgi:PII-like signaling protein
MENQSSAIVLRIYLSSTDKNGNEIMYESIVFKAKEAGLPGATVIKGVFGYGASSVIHSYKFWEISDKLPVVVEIIDTEEKVMAFYESIRPTLESMRYGCLVVTERVNVLLDKPGMKRNY